MPRLESYGSLLPLAIAAGLLSGTFLRQPATPPETPKPPAKTAEAAPSQESLSTSPWLSDLRPVMESMGDAMGMNLQRPAASRTAGVAAAELDRLQPAEVTGAIAKVRGWVDSRFTNAVNACSTGDPLSGEARTLNAYLLDQDSGASRKLRAAAAESAMSPFTSPTASCST